MADGATLGSALEREHREIDGGIEKFAAGLEAGGMDTEPLLQAMAGLRRHIYLEEEFLFPPLRANGMMMPIFVMLCPVTPDRGR
jgi:regulator of cell morphogenesis and NO signaling